MGSRYRTHIRHAMNSTIYKNRNDRKKEKKRRKEGEVGKGLTGILDMQSDGTFFEDLFSLYS